MDPKEYRTPPNLPPDMPPVMRSQPMGCFTFNLIFNLFLLCCIGIGIIFILHLFGHYGQYTLIAGITGMLLQALLYLWPKLPWSRHRVRNRMRDSLSRRFAVGNTSAQTDPRPEGEVAADRRFIRKMAFRSLLISVVVVAVAFIGMALLPADPLPFAILAGILGFTIWFAVCVIGLSLLVLFLSHTSNPVVHKDDDATYIDF
ncbi:hypothetical protein KDA_43650 [Dictyobacter alpinus]|uniref:Uncharacterized protein n=1 Tax=Dictyobacter alpinus TaxID=2014873 RepID=A0A402BBS4_9CHLR|nr:hypothetical protein [Dictyobacter alpinus]GCE28881.1 hypothetical protein KDA_43650 [Dictyobacter alpinus]